MLFNPIEIGTKNAERNAYVGTATDTALMTAPIGKAAKWGMGKVLGESALKTASKAAFQASKNIGKWIPKNKHLLGTTARRSAQFSTNKINEVRSIVAEALTSKNATFLPNNVDKSFRVVTDLGREIGTKGQTSVRVIFGKDGKIWNAFPVNKK